MRYSSALLWVGRVLLTVTESLRFADTHVRFGPGNPRLQKERQARLVEPAGGLHGDEDVLQLQFRLGDTCAFRDRGAAVLTRFLRVVGRNLPDGMSVTGACFDKAAGPKVKIHVEDDEDGEDHSGQPPTYPSLMHGRKKWLRLHKVLKVLIENPHVGLFWPLCHLRRCHRCSSFNSSIFKFLSIKIIK